MYIAHSSTIPGQPRDELKREEEESIQGTIVVSIDLLISVLRGLLLASCFEESRKLVGACILSLYSSLYFFAKGLSV